MKSNLFKIAIFMALLANAVGCSNNKYHGEIYDDIEGNINQAFLDSNKIDTSKINERSKKIIHKVDSVDSFSVVFNKDYELNIDYEKQFLIVFSFSSVYKTKHFIERIDLNDGELKIVCNYEKGENNSGYATSPYQRWCSIKMDIVDYETISFIGE